MKSSVTDEYMAAFRPDDLPEVEHEALVERIVTTPREPFGRQASVARSARRRSRWVVAVVGVAAAAGATLGITNRLSSPTHSPSMQLVDIVKSHGYYTIKITDPSAGEQQLDAAFRAHGLDISVHTIAASPSLVGTISFYEGLPGVQTVFGRICVGQGEAVTYAHLNQCPIGFRIPTSFHGKGAVDVGRAARPGEHYETIGNAFSPGEVLACSGILGKPVAEATAFAKAHHLAIMKNSWTIYDTTKFPEAGDPTRARSTAPTNGIIVAGGNDSAGGALQFAVDTVVPSNRSWTALLAGATEACKS